MEARRGKREVNVAVLLCGRKNGVCFWVWQVQR
jgi:hypothetical protein